jgi:hypothetical protein
MCRINPNKAIAKAPERVQLEGGLDAQNEVILL